MSYETLDVRFQDPFCFVKLNRPDEGNSINGLMIRELHQVLDSYGQPANAVVLSGLPGVFCAGSDITETYEKMIGGQLIEHVLEPLYDLFLRLTEEPYITISHVSGKANDGGIGFVAASDIVLAGQEAQFCLSELSLGLLPACALPFIARRIGLYRTNYMTLMAQSITVQQAHEWGLVDAYDDRSEVLLRKHLLRFKYLSKTAIIRYKRYMNQLNPSLIKSKASALEAVKEVISDREIIERIRQYMQ